MSSENINFYKLKYLKYKNKYFDLKKMIGSGNCAISGQCTKSETAKLRHKYSEVNNDEQINTTTKGRATKEAQAAKRRAAKKAQEAQEVQEVQEAQEAQEAKRRATKEAKEAQEAQASQAAKRRATKEAQEAQEAKRRTTKEAQEAQATQAAEEIYYSKDPYIIELRNLRNLERAEEEAIKTPREPKSIELSEKLCENKFKELYEYFKNNYKAISEDLYSEKIDLRFELQVLIPHILKDPHMRWELLHIKDINKNFDVNEVLKYCRNYNSKIIDIIRKTILFLQQDFQE